MDLTIEGETRVAVAGDWHGSTTWAAKALATLANEAPEVRTVLHAGDFGLFHSLGGRTFLEAVDRDCASAGIDRILVTPGNHEDWAWLDADFAAMPGLPIPVSRAVSVLPRGFRFTLADTSFLSFGGAASIDYELRSAREWWLTEIPTDEEVAAAIAGGHADVLLTHETVDGGTTAGEGILRRNPAGWSPEALTYSALSRERVTRLWNAIRPELLVHGHLHVADQIELIDGRRVVSLGCDGQENNMGLLQLRALDWVWVDGLAPGARVRRTRDIEGLYLTRPDPTDPA